MLCTIGTVYSYLYDNPHPQFLQHHKPTSGAMCLYLHHRGVCCLVTRFEHVSLLLYRVYLNALHLHTNSHQQF